MFTKVIKILLVMLGVGEYFAYNKFITDKDEDNQNEEETNNSFESSGFIIKAGENCGININGVDYPYCYVGIESFDDKFAIVKAMNIFDVYYLIDMNGEWYKDGTSSC